jgi:hypothetical protein
VRKEVKKEVTDSNNSVAKDTMCHSNLFHI